MPESITNIAKHVESRNYKERTAYWKFNLLDTVLSEGFLETSGTEFCSQIFQTLYSYNDYTSQRAVLSVIQDALQNEVFLKIFTAALVRHASSSLNVQASTVLVQWSCAVLARIDVNSARKAVTKLIESQASLLDSLLLHEPKWIHAARSLKKVITKKPELISEIAAVFKSNGSPSFARVLLNYDDQFDSVTTVFCEKVLCGKDKPRPQICMCYKELGAKMSDMQMSSKVLPAVSRAFKRVPEVAITAFTSLLSYSQLDMGNYSLELLEAIVPQVRLKEAIRPSATAFLSELAKHVEEPKALGILTQRVLSILDGSAEGKMKVAAERAALAGLVAALACSPASGDDAAQISNKTATALLALYKDEGAEDGKIALLNALGPWLARCASSPIGAVPHFTAGLKEAKENLRRAHLRALEQGVAGSVTVAAGLADLAEPLAKTVNEAMTKVTLRPEGLVSMHCAALLASSSTEADASLEKNKVWGAPVMSESPLLSTAVVAKSGSAECCSAVALCEVLLTRHRHRLAAHEGSRVNVCRLLISLLLHHNATIRRATRAAAERALGVVGGDLMLDLLEALRAAMNKPSSIPTLLDPEEKDTFLSPSCLARRSSRAFLALLPTPPPVKPEAKPVFPPSAAMITPELLTSVLLTAHHRCATYPSSPSAAAFLWCTARKHLQLSCGGLGAYSEELVESLMMGPAGIQSSEVLERDAAMAALRTCMADSADNMWYHLKSALIQLLEHADHDALTADQLDVYDTPEGMLAMEKIPEGVYIPEVVESKSIKKPKGRMKAGSRAFASSSEEDDEPAPAKKPPAAAATRPASMVANGAGGRGGRGGAVAGGRGGKKEGMTKQEEFRQRRLAEEAETRAYVASIKARIELGLHVLDAAERGCPPFTARNLEHFSALCLPLLASPLVGSAAFSTVYGLCTVLPGSLGAQAIHVAAGLRASVAARQAGASASAVASTPAVEYVVRSLSAVTAGNKPLPSPAYVFIFPLLQAVLGLWEYTRLHDDALAVVGLHVAVGEDIPRSPLLELLYHVLGVVPAYRDRISPLLSELCAGASKHDLPAALSGLLAGSASVRAAALAALPHVPLISTEQLPEDPALSAVLHIARHDENETNVANALELWEMSGATLRPEILPALYPHLTGEHSDVRGAAARAVAAAMSALPGSSAAVLGAITELYTTPGSTIAAKLGCAVGLSEAAPQFAEEQVRPALDFLITYGLCDEDDSVREAMVAAGGALVDSHGAVHGQSMLQLFEGHIGEGGKRNGVDEGRYDLVREGVVVLLGTLARHLDPADPKRAAIVEMLLGVMSTPSEAVQRAVSGCLSPLMGPLSSDRTYMEELVKRLLTTLTSGPSFGARRGAAFGLAGVVKGLGISAIKGYGIMDALKVAVEDKNNANAREGAVLGFECLSEKLGKLFEPYITSILPLLLGCFGDMAPHVRAATEDAARMIMGQLTAPGVKLVLPSLLKGLEDKVWRTKAGSVQLLGAMAYCAPRQLGTCLPTIVPALGEVLSDPHPKVQEGAREALQQIGSVIRNPEIQSLVPHLLSAIASPATATRPCLDVLLETVFVHTIDAASLALIAPVVHRGLRDRSGDTKKRAGRIVGNMASLVNDGKDLAPYVPLLMPELQKALVDPLPEVRAVVARAMGSLLKGMGAEHFSSLVPWLLEMLRSEGSSVERSGAAQGLAEVLSVLGTGHLEALLPDILAGCRARAAATREGHLTLFQFLPLALTSAFQPYLATVLPCILGGLSDEGEGVRDAALAAGRVFVDTYAHSALTLLLPAIEEGVFGESWRIRQASVKLLGKLLFKIAGTSGNVVVDGGSDDEGVAEEVYDSAITEALGFERRNEVLARLYITRSDVQHGVRNEALHVWKTVVVNTPKTLGQILPALMKLVIAGLASDGEDARTSAARCLGELVRKMGDRVLGRVIPILQEGVSAESGATRQGVCYGLKEVLENMSRGQLTEHLAEVLPPVQTALCDPEPAVREAAGAAFAILFRGNSGSAVESVVPTLLTGLESPDRFDASLEGLRVILGVRPTTFNFLVPKLLKPPLRVTSLTALGSLSAAAPAILPNHLATILNALLGLASNVGREEVPAQEIPTAAAAALALVAAAVDEEALHVLVSEILRALDDTVKRRGAINLTAVFAADTKHDLSEHVPGFLNSLIVLLAEDDLTIQSTAWSAISAVCGCIPKDEAAMYVRPLRDAVASAREKERRKRRGGALTVGGLVNVPKALAPLLPIYLQGVLQGASPEVREMAAEGLGELLDVVTSDALKPFVVQVTGPLIRIIGDRFPSQVKAAILTTLGALIDKAGIGLKPFVPQLQTTFVKCLPDASSTVRTRAAANLGALSKLAPRLDTLVNDLAVSAKTADHEVREAYVSALRGTIATSGERLTAPALTSVITTLQAVARSAGDDMALRARLASAYAAWLFRAASEDLKPALTAPPLGPLSPFPSDTSARTQVAMAAAAVAGSAAARIEEAGVVPQFIEMVSKFSRDPEITTRIAAGRAAARLAAALPSTMPSTLPILAALLSPDQSSEVQRQALIAARCLVPSPAAATAADGHAPAAPVPSSAPLPLERHMGLIMPWICGIVTSSSGPVKVAAERTVAILLRISEGDVVASRYLASGPGTTVKAALTEAFVKRLQRLTFDEEFAEEEY